MAEKETTLTAFEILSELLDSSSSSSEDVSSGEDVEIIALISKSHPEKKSKIKNYMEVVNAYSDEEFRRHFRLRRETYKKIRNEFEKSDIYQSTLGHGGTITISPELSILAFLWYAGNKSCIRDIADRFGVADSTVHVVFSRVMTFLYQLAPSIIKFPTTEEEKSKVADDFSKISGFPGVLGCIDGTYIPIRTPANKLKSTYVNRHDMSSITLQAVCDSNKLFLDVFTGTPSKIHDARIFSLSFISKNLPEICGDRFHILGDSAYPLREYLITPFRDYGHLTEEQRNFNKKFSATRVKIENAFGLLKQRWRQLKYLEFTSVGRITDFIITCCVLHNLCIINKDYSDDNDGSPTEDDEQSQSQYRDSDQVAKRLGGQKRSFLCETINTI